MYGHTDWITAVELINKDNFISWSYDGTTRIWNIKTLIHKIYDGFNNRIQKVFSVRDNNFLSFFHNSISIWDTRTISHKKINIHSSINDIILISEDFFVAYTKDALYLFNISELALLSVYHFERIDKVFKTYDKNKLICFSDSGECRIIKIDFRQNISTKIKTI